MTNTQRQVYSALIAGSLVAGTATIALLAESPIEAITLGQWVTIALGGLGAAAKDIKTLLANPTV